MADYNYDEGGILATYFLITFLALILVPLTLSLSPSKKNHDLAGCQCKPCLEQRARNSQRDKGSLLNPKLSKKHIILIAGWSLLAFLSYRVAGAKLESTVYDPFQILGISSSSTEKEIKKHYRKLALKFHPDKVKPTVNQTLDDISSYFTDLTKAYKALTDEDIRENLRKWGHPDGRQPTSTGIALPKWIIEGHNNKWVLGLYGILFGGALPAIVGRWWFGSREKTKDGVHAQSAAILFKNLKEESTVADVVHLLAQTYEFELPTAKVPADGQVAELEKTISTKLGSQNWNPGKVSEKTRLALVLLYAHMLRLKVSSPALQKLQTEILLHTPTLINSFFNLCISRNWLIATLSILRASSYLVQAVEPGSVDNRWTQLPGVSESESQSLHAAGDLEEVISQLNGNQEAVKAAESVGEVELVDASYKVIGERVVVPASIVYVVAKLRLSPLNESAKTDEPDVDETKRRIKVNDAKDIAFLEGRGEELESLTPDLTTVGYAHAPHWPSNRKPSWWLILADEKSNRLVVPPTKVTEIPYANPSQPDGRDYRSYKFQFQAPQSVGLFTWKLYIVSDTYIGQEVKKDMILKIDDASVLDAEDAAEDEISEPDEDSLAGQMALMKGGKVKRAAQDEESDDESDTDGDESSGSSSDSD